jgi:hypothetical protein
MDYLFGNWIKFTKIAIAIITVVSMKSMTKIFIAIRLPVTPLPG